jgi:hypothetical protein
MYIYIARGMQAADQQKAYLSRAVYTNRGTGLLNAKLINQIDWFKSLNDTARKRKTGRHTETRTQYNITT